MITFPSGRARQWALRAAVAIAYVSVVLATALDEDVGALFLAALRARHLRSRCAATTGPAHRGAVHAFTAAAFFAGALIVLPVQHAVGFASVQAAADLSSVLIATSAIWLAVAAVRARWTESSALGLVVDVGRRAGGLRERLRRTGGDPAWSSGTGSPGPSPMLTSPGLGSRPAVPGEP